MSGGSELAKSESQRLRLQALSQTRLRQTSAAVPGAWQRDVDPASEQLEIEGLIGYEDQASHVWHLVVVL